MKKEEKKKPEDYIKQINSIIDYYNNFEDSNVTKDSIVKTRENYILEYLIIKKLTYGMMMN